MTRRQRLKRTPHSYSQRTYRHFGQSGLVTSRVQMMETDLLILAPARVDEEALAAVARLRHEIEQYIDNHPDFLHALAPMAQDQEAPASVQKMLAAGIRAGVGPMAAVAGTVAEGVGQALENCGHGEVIVENGGDIYIRRTEACTIAVYAGESPLSGRVGIKLHPLQMPCGVCTSSASIGHSLSLGDADAAVVVASSTAYADALATRLGNEVRQSRDGVGRALEVAQKFDDITGVVLIAGEKLGAWGALQLVQVEPQAT